MKKKIKMVLTSVLSSVDCYKSPLPTSESQLTGWRSTVYKIHNYILLTPKLLFSGAGWAVGFCLGGNIGAGIGDALGTFVGCAISLGVEYLLKKYVFGMDTNGLLRQRAKEATILCAGSLLGGLIFNPAYKWTASLSKFGDWNLTRSVATGLITASGFMAGTSAARMGYTLAKDKEYGLSEKNFINDLKTSLLTIAPAEAAFVATSLPLLTSKWLVIKSAESTAQKAIKSGTSVFIGGTAGALIKERVESFASTAA